MLLIGVQEVSRQLAWEALNAGYRGVVTKGVDITTVAHGGRTIPAGGSPATTSAPEPVTPFHQRCAPCPSPS